MIDPILVANGAIKIMQVIRLAELALDLMDQTDISMKKLVEARAQAKREGRDNLNEAEMQKLFDDTQAAIDSITQ